MKYPFKFGLTVVLISGALPAFSSAIDVQIINDDIRNGFGEVESILNSSRDEIQILLREKGNLQPTHPFSIYSSNGKESFSDHYHHGYSNFYITYKTPITNELKEFIQVSERFDDIFIKNQKQHQGIGWQTVIDFKFRGMRVFPWFDADALMGPDLDWSEFDFYKKSIANDDPNKMICSVPSIDVAGLGFITTCTLPIYLYGKKWGIFTVDISFDDFFKKIRSHLGHTNDEFAFLIYPEKNFILLKPLFYNYLYKNTLSVTDLKSADGWIIEKSKYSTQTIDLPNGMGIIKLLILSKVAE